MLVLTLSGTFINALTISTIARLFSYGATCLALPLLRRRSGTARAMFKVPGGVELICGVPERNNPNMLQFYEATRSDIPTAVRAVIDQIDRRR